MNSMQIGFVVYIAAILISRNLAASAAKLLTVEDRAKLVDVEGGSIGLFLVIPLLLGYWFSMSNFPDYFVAITAVFLSTGLLLTVILIIRRHMRIKSFNFPTEYVRKVAVSMSVQVVATVVFFGLVARYVFVSTS